MIFCFCFVDTLRQINEDMTVTPSAGVGLTFSLLNDREGVHNLHNKACLPSLVLSHPWNARIGKIIDTSFNFLGAYPQNLPFYIGNGNLETENEMPENRRTANGIM